MKRLLAYLFLVLGLGLTFSVNSYSAVYCVDDKIDERIANFKPDYPKRENEFFYFSEQSGACIGSYTQVTYEQYNYFKNLFSREKLKIAKAEPSQTQEVATYYENLKPCYNTSDSGMPLILKPPEHTCDDDQVAFIKEVLKKKNPKLDYYFNFFKAYRAFGTDPKLLASFVTLNEKTKLHHSLKAHGFDNMSVSEAKEYIKQTQIAKAEPSQKADVKRPICVSVGIPNYYVFTSASCKGSMQYVISPTHSLYDYYNNQNFNKSINELSKKDAIFLIDQLKKGRTYKHIKKKYSLNKKQINLLRKIKIKNETKNINKYVKILNQGKSLEYFFLEKVTLDKVVDAKTKLEEKNISKYVAILSKGEKLDKYFLEKITIPKVIKLKILTEEKNIDKYLEANLKGSDLSEFYLENETIELVKAKRQERREALYAKTCTGWIFGHKKGTFEWFKCLEEKEQKELFQGSETKIVKNIENKKTKSEKIIKTTSTDNEAPILQVVEVLTVTDPRYSIEGKVTDKGSDKIYLKVDGQDIPLNKGKFKINRYSPVDENIKITAIDKWGNEVTKIIKVSVNLESTDIAEALEPLNASKIRSKSSNNKVALIIGIENYTEVPNANYANLDAKYFYDYAIKAFGVKKQNINLLIDENATFVKTDKALSLWLKTKIKENQSDLIIFFAGHGLASSDGKSLYLLPQDGNPDRLNRSAFSRSELFQEIINLNPKSVTMFLDTCYSGVSRDEEMLLASARPIRIVADEQEGIPDNFTIFTASQLDQISSGLKEAEHGIFSYYLMKGLEGKADSNKDKKITNGELLAYMDVNVSQKASELGRQQNPSLAGDPNKILMSYR